MISHEFMRPDLDSVRVWSMVAVLAPSEEAAQAARGSVVAESRTLDVMRAVGLAAVGGINFVEEARGLVIGTTIPLAVIADDPRGLWRYIGVLATEVDGLEQHFAGMYGRNEDFF